MTLALVMGSAGATETARPELEHVLSMLNKERASGDATFFTDSYLSTLTIPVQLEIARRLSADSSTQYASYGALLLVRLKHAEEAVAPTARLLLTGSDVSGLFWSWRNFDDPCLTDFMTVQLGSYLLRQHRTLHFAQRRRAEAYLATLGPPAGPFREDVAQANLRIIRDRLGGRGCPKLDGE